MTGLERESIRPVFGERASSWTIRALKRFYFTGAHSQHSAAAEVFPADLSTDSGLCDNLPFELLGGFGKGGQTDAERAGRVRFG